MNWPAQVICKRVSVSRTTIHANRYTHGESIGRTQVPLERAIYLRDPRMTLPMAIYFPAVGGTSCVQVRPKRDEPGPVVHDVFETGAKDPVPGKVRLDEECLVR